MFQGRIRASYTGTSYLDFTDLTEQSGLR